MDWTASWIWHPPAPQMDNLYLYARRELRLDDPPREALVYVTAGSLYKLYVNGHYVQRGPNPSDPSRYYYDVWPVGEWLREGVNTIAVVAYCYGAESKGIIGQNWGPGGLLLELRESRDGRVLAATDGTWRVLRSPAWDQDTPINCTLYGDYKETVDTRLEPEGWMEAGFDDSAWAPAHVLGRPPVAPYTGLVEREIPALGGPVVRPQEAFWESASVTYAWRDDWEVYHEARLVPGRAHTDRSGRPCEVRKTHEDFDPAVLLDFGTLVTGYPEMRLAGSGGGVVDVLYGESLNLTRVDRFILRGGPQVLQPFNRRTFRYMKLLFRDTPSTVLLDSVSMQQNTYPVEYVGDFGCSDDLLNRIWDVGRYTMHLSMLDHFVDCPWRERTIYGGDVYPENLIAYYAFGDPRLAQKTLRQMFALQHDDGAVPPYGPYRGCDSFYPAWSAYLGLAYFDLYDLTGDRAFLEELWPNVERLIEWAMARVDESGVDLIGEPEGSHKYPEWLAAPRERYTAWANAPFLHLLRRGGTYVGPSGREGARARYGGAAGRLEAAVRSRLFGGPADMLRAARQGKLSQADAAYALWAGAHDLQGARAVSDLVLRGTAPPLGSPFNAFFAVEGLFGAGEPQRALDFIRRYWGDMLARGATTFWEHFSLDWAPGVVPDRGISLCHGWSAGPTYSLPAHVLGVRLKAWRAGAAAPDRLLTSPLGPAIVVAPQPCDLDWAHGRVPTPRGPVDVAWWRTASEFRLEVDVPDGFDALAVVPWAGPRGELLVDGADAGGTPYGAGTAVALPSGRHEVLAR